jgi:hypothetical protein
MNRAALAASVVISIGFVAAADDDQGIQGAADDLETLLVPRRAPPDVGRLAGRRLERGIGSCEAEHEPTSGVSIDECPELKTPSATFAHDAEVTARPRTRSPMLVTGDSAQPLRWIAERADGWLTYPRSIERQAMAVARWRAEVQAVAPGRFKPFAQSLCVDLADSPSLAPTPIHLGFKAGRHFVLRFLESLRLVGVNHVVLNLHHGARAPGEVLEEIGTEVLAPLAAVAQGAERIGAEFEAAVGEGCAPAQH